MPVGMTAPEIEMWESVIAYVPEEVLAGADTKALTALCKWWGIYFDLQGKWDSAEVEKDRPSIYEISKAWAHCERLLGEFGMTPNARAKVKVIPKQQKQEEADPLQAYVA